MHLGTMSSQVSPALPAAAARDAARVTLATFNVWNMFDTEDDPRSRDTIYAPADYHARKVKIAGLIARDMGAPDVVSLQEVENARVLDDLLAMPQMAGLGYRYVLASKADTRGIRNAILYRPAKVELRSVEEPNPFSTLPPEDPVPIGSDRLFSRSPMIATFGLAGARDAAAAATFVVINSHFKSKLGGDAHEPRRQAQGAFIGGVVDALHGADAAIPIFVASDLNATWNDGAYQRIQQRRDGSERMLDTLASLPDADRYTYNYRGKLELLDHLMVNRDAAQVVEGVRILHVNTATDSLEKRFNPRTVHGTSDHDPIVATLRFDSVRAAVAGAGATR